MAEMTSDPTEHMRRQMIASGAPERDLATAGERWTTEELREQFEVIGFAAPFAIVRRKADGVLGSLEFTHSPRVYFNFRYYEGIHKRSSRWLRPLADAGAAVPASASDHSRFAHPGETGQWLTSTRFITLSSKNLANSSTRSPKLCSPQSPSQH